MGGSVRNLLLGKPCLDWDLATDGDFHKLGRLLANTLHGFYAPMHDRACRVVVKHAEQECSFDLSPLHGSDIQTDLHDRDFTLNAIAIPLIDLLPHLQYGSFPPLIDPLQGYADLQSRTLRAVSPSVFQNDPLRMLRAIRFMTHYSLSLEDQTRQQILQAAPLIVQVAGERVHEELYRILHPSQAIVRLRQLDDLGLLTALIPELVPARGMPQPGLHNWDVFDHSLETVATLERLSTIFQQTPAEIRRSPLEDPDQGHLTAIAALLQDAQQQGVFSLATLDDPTTKLAALLHDIGKPPTCHVDEAGAITFYHHPQVGVPIAQQIMQRFQASTQERRVVQQVVAHHMRPGQLSGASLTPRAIRRYFLDLGPTGILVALVSLADHLSMRGPLPLTEHWQRHLATVHVLLSRYIQERHSILPPRLLQGDEIMRRFHLSPGPLIGQLLEKIAEAQAEGRVHSRDEALWLVSESLSALSPNSSETDR